MNNLIKYASALAVMIICSSCQQEFTDNTESVSTVTYSVEIPDVAATKTLGGGTNINNLVYAVYKTDADSLEAAITSMSSNKLVYRSNPKASNQTTAFSDGKAHVTIELINNQKYIILFWAQVDEEWISGTGFDLTNVVYPDELDANDDKYSAFSGVSYIAKVKGTRNASVTLSRPFAQVNIASVAPKGYKVNVTSSSVKIYGAAESFNVATQTASEDVTDVVFGDAATPSGPFNDTYPHYIAMNYVFANDNVSVGYTINTDHGNMTCMESPISNVPIAKNHRTNIIGNLLTNEVDYDVTIEKNWDTPETNIYVSQHDKEIRYTATEKVHAHYYADGRFGANYVSNSWDNTTGNGVITFDAPVTKIGIDAFYERQHLTAVSIPNGVTVIEENAFKSCPNLTSVTFSENIVAIGIRAFYACVSLTNVVLPKSLTTIGESAFDGIPGLKLYFNSTTPPSVEATPFLNSTEIYVPAASLDEYKESWGNLVQYVDQIKSFNEIISD